MTGRTSTRAPALTGRGGGPDECGVAAVDVGSTFTAAVPGAAGQRRARHPGRCRAAGRWLRRPAAGRVRQGCFPPAACRAVPGPGAATGDGPGSGPPRARRPWKPRSRRGVPARSRPPCHPTPALARCRWFRLCSEGSDGRRACLGRLDGHREPLRRSRYCAAVVARLPARLPRPPERTRSASGRQAGAALGTTGRDDGATGPGAHAQPEAVGLRAPAVVRLVGALAHVRLSVVGRPGRGRRGRGGPGHRCGGPDRCCPGGCDASRTQTPFPTATPPRTPR